MVFYFQVMNILLGSCGVDVDPIDFDGWTPLHASAHWGQQEATSILVQYGADMDIKNYVVSSAPFFQFLEENPSV